MDAKIIFKAYDLYEHSIDESNRRTGSYVMAKQPDGEFGYFNTNQFALTSSNTFVGEQTINGNLTINGDINANQFIVTTSSVNHFTASTNFGLDDGDTHTFTGSVRITGSLNTIGSSTITGSFLVSGSTTQIGNNILIGRTELSGSIAISGSTEFGGNLFPKESRGATIGTLERPFRDIYLQSASINIASDIPGGRNASISNADGNVTIQAAGFQLKSASFVSFEISEEGLTTIRTPKQILGTESAINIIGSNSGYQQPRNFSGSLLQMTAQDGQPARISIDSYGTGTYGLIAARSARGTVDIPTQTKSGDTLLRLTAQGWTNTNTFIGSISRINLEANEDFTTSAAGTKISFQTTPKGSTLIQTSATIDPTGLFVSGAFTSSLSQGYIWVGDSNNRTKLFSTSSLAITGSNVFSGSQGISGSLYVSSSLNITDGFYVNGNKQFNYGQWCSLQTQSGSANTAYAMKLETQTDGSSGFYVGNNGSGFPTRIYAQNTGLYNIQFSAQLHTTANEACDFSVWFAMTGSNMVNSNTDFTIEKINGGGFQVAALNFLTPISSGSYVELYWSKTTANGQLQAKGVQSTPTRPATPSVIVTLTQIG